MSDSKPQNDPSMDDILASIRKIISDDEARAAADPGAAASSPPQRPMQPAPPRSEAAKPAAQSSGQSSAQSSAHSVPTPASDDVLLLTELVEEPPPLPPGVSAMQPMARGVGTRPFASPSIAPIPSPAAMGINEPQPPSASPARPMTPPFGRDTAGRAFGGPERPGRVVTDSESIPAPPMAATPTAVGGKSVEDLVREMLRPMLQEWMDKNLPGIVEKVVERELERSPPR